MKPRSILSLILFLIYNTIAAQSGDTITHSYKRTQTLYYAAAGPSVAIGEFATTHSFGTGIEAGGLTLFNKKGQQLRKHPLLLQWGIAGDYYWGKKQTIAGYPYTYKRYLLTHALLGGTWKLYPNLLLSLTGGPGLSRYNGSMRYNTTVQAAVHYAITKKIMLSPVFKLFQEPGTDWLGSAGLRVVFVVR